MEHTLLGGIRCLVWRRPGAGRMVLLHGFTGHPASWEPVVARIKAPGLARTSHRSSAARPDLAALAGVLGDRPLRRTGSTPRGLTPTCAHHHRHLRPLATNPGENCGLVVAPFLPGHDPQAPRFGWASFQEAVDALAAAVRELHPGPWRLVGYSLGARVALGLLLGAQELWADAVLVGVHPGLEDEPSRLTRRDEDARRASTLRKRGIGAFVEEWERLPLFATQAGLPAAVTVAQRAQRLAHDAGGLARSLEVLGVGAMPDTWPALPGIRTPVRVVVGEHDTRFAPIAARAAGLLPAGELVIVPGVGHNVVLEAPGAVSKLLEGGAERDLREHGEDR